MIALRFGAPMMIVATGSQPYHVGDTLHVPANQPESDSSATFALAFDYL